MLADSLCITLLDRPTNEAWSNKLSVVSFYACHHNAFSISFSWSLCFGDISTASFLGGYRRAIAFSSWSLSEAPFDVLLLNRRSMNPMRFPSGLLDQTLDRRLVPSAFNRTGYITSEGLPEGQKLRSVTDTHSNNLPRRTPTNIPRTTDTITLLRFNGNPTVLRPVT